VVDGRVAVVFDRVAVVLALVEGVLVRDIFAASPVCTCYIYIYIYIYVYFVCLKSFYIYIFEYICAGHVCCISCMYMLCIYIYI